MKLFKSFKVKICLIVALALICVFALGSFFGLTALANRNVTISGTSIFNVSGNAEVWAHKVARDTVNENGETVEDEDPYYYTMFTFLTDNDLVSYRRNLAYRWFANARDYEDYDQKDEPYEGENGNWWVRGDDTQITYDETVKPAVGDNGNWFIGGQDTGFKTKLSEVKMEEGFFNIEIGFEELNFKKFVLTFETQQFSMTKDEKTTNYVIFLPETGDDGELSGNVIAIITDEKDMADPKKETTAPQDAISLAPDHIVIALSQSAQADNGEYAVSVYNAGADLTDETKVQKGVFTNVGETYAKWVSSSTKPVTPLSFSAVMADVEDATSIKRVRMALYEMNGQSFVLNRNYKGETLSSPSRQITSVENDDGSVHYTGGTVNDTLPPVLCLDKNLTFVTEGNELSFSYTAIDVLAQSPFVDTGYFMLTTAQAADTEFNPEDYEAKNLFTVVKDEYDKYIYPHSQHYFPTSENYDANVYANDDFTPTAAVKIYVKLTDTSSSGGQSTCIFLDWFVPSEYLLKINGYNYIAVAKDTKGAHYNYDSTEYTAEHPYTDKNGVDHTGWDGLLAEYQDRVDEAAKNLRAGSSEDFYLPSLEKLLSDNATPYADMTFSIYYMANGNRSSNTNKVSSQLSIDLNNAGDYLFTVYANDSVSNEMWYYDENKQEDVEFSTGDIWTMYDDEDDEGLYDRLPWFTFSADISEITVEDPGEQDMAYVGTSYSAGSFDIEGISTDATYTLYRFNNDLYYEARGTVLTYEQFMAQKAELFENHRNYFTNIPASNTLEEGSEDYEKFYAYDWNSTGLSFVPQDENAFYLIKCEVTSTQFPDMQPVKQYMGIAAAVTPDPIHGEDTWVQDNLASIILLSIAGAAFIGIILLLVIKPKDTGDIDAQYEEEVAAESKKKKSKK